ncbi:MAG: hypothetical protein ACKOTA_10475, partial [Solirubrobacterales bacterium]
MSRTPLALIATAVLATGALALAGCGSDDEGSDGPKDFTLVQEKPEIIEADNGARSVAELELLLVGAVGLASSYKLASRAGVVA